MEQTKFGFKPLTKANEKYDTLEGRVIAIKDIKALKYIDANKKEIGENEYRELLQDGVKVGRVRKLVGQVATLVVLNESDEETFIKLNTSFGTANNMNAEEYKVHDGEYAKVTGILLENPVKITLDEKGKKVYTKCKNEEATLIQYRICGITKVERVVD